MGVRNGEVTGVYLPTLRHRCGGGGGLVGAVYMYMLDIGVAGLLSEYSFHAFKDKQILRNRFQAPSFDIS